MCFSLKGWMKCRNWRTEEPEDPEEPESPESPESPEASGKGPSGPLRKIRNLRKSQAQAAPHANICFLPQNHRLCADLFALPPRIYARNAARPCAADRKTHPPRTIIRFLAFPSGTGRRPLRNLRNPRNRPARAAPPPPHPLRQPPRAAYSPFAIPYITFQGVIHLF